MINDPISSRVVCSKDLSLPKNTDMNIDEYRVAFPRDFSTAYSMVANTLRRRHIFSPSHFSIENEPPASAVKCLTKDGNAWVAFAKLFVQEGRAWRDSEVSDTSGDFIIYGN